MIYRNTTILILFLVSLSSGAVATDMFEQVTGGDDDSYERYVDYWDKYDRFFKESLKSKKNKIYANLAQVNEEIDQLDKDTIAAKVDLLKKSQEKYFEALKSSESTNSRAIVLFNLSRTYFEIAKLKKNISEDFDTEINSSLDLLKTIRNDYPNFRLMDEVVYIQAQIADQMDSSKAHALEYWQYLASLNIKSKYVALGNLYFGDAQFLSGNTNDALKHFHQAKVIFEYLGKKEFMDELIDANYRLAWASYRVGDFSSMMASARFLLNNFEFINQSDEKNKILYDLIELMADAFYEKASIRLVKQSLSDTAHKFHMASVALEVLKKYIINERYQDASQLGEWVMQRFAFSENYPEIALFTALANKKLLKYDKYIQTLESLAMLTAKDSLWRQQNREKINATRKMELLALNANRTVSLYYYEKGSISNNRNYFKKAVVYFDHVAKFSDKIVEREKWSLRKINCMIKAGMLYEASNELLKIQQNVNISGDNRQKLFFLKANVQREIWLQEYALDIGSGKKVVHDEYNKLPSNSALSEYMTAVDEYATLYPRSAVTMDLVLDLATSLKDNRIYDEAIRFWKKVLLSDSTQIQRVSAIRGIIFCLMKLGNNRKLILSINTFLNDYSVSDDVNRSELLQILSIALLEEGKRLESAGKIDDAIVLYASYYEKLKDSLPYKAKILRELAYLNALQGNWHQAFLTCGEYINNVSDKELDGDMHYLLAKSLHYQFEFKEAMNSYFSFARNYPKHRMASKAMAIAGKLADSFMDYALQGKILQILGDQEADLDRRKKYYVRSYEVLDNIKDKEAQMVLIDKLRKLRSNRSEIISYDLMEADTKIGTRDNYYANRLVSLADRAIDKYRYEMSSNSFNLLKAHTFLLKSKYLINDLDIDIDDNIIDQVDEGKFLSSFKKYDAISNYLIAATKYGQNKFVYEARYKLALLSNRFRDFFISNMVEGRGSFNEEKLSSYEKSIAKLDDIAKKSLADNISISISLTNTDRDNQWIKKSHMLYSQYSDNESMQREYYGKLPEVSGYDIPLSWGQ